MKRIFFLYILSLALFAAAPVYGACTVDLICKHDRAPGGTLRFILLKRTWDGSLVEIARTLTCSFPSVSWSDTKTFIACATEGTVTACDSDHPLTLACLTP